MTFPPPRSWLSVRPPTRLRASSTSTDLPFALSARAADRPDSPAPTTTTSHERRLPFPAAAAVRGRAAAPPATATPPISPRRVTLGCAIATRDVIGGARD